MYPTKCFFDNLNNDGKVKSIDMNQKIYNKMVAYELPMTL